MKELGKQEFRRRFRTRIAAMREEEKKRQSEVICDRIREHPRWKAAETVLLFHPMKDEPDILPILSETLATERRLFLPRYNPATEGYDIVRVIRLDDDLRSGRFGILEPNTDCGPLHGNHLDFIAVPGLGFDVAGRRLGRGMGFYDRMLRDLKGFLCGLSFDCQLCVEIPVEPHDLGLNVILTPSRCIEVRRDG